MKNFFFKVTHEASTAGELSLLFPRVAFGLSMALAHGLGKMPPAEGFISAVGSMGFPAPELFAWAAALSEFLGGLLLAAGLFTRPAAVFLSLTMAVAALIVHGSDPYQKQELSLLYLAVYLLFAIRGGGKWSLDAVIRK